MIELMPESSGNFLAVKVSGKLTDEDYKNFWIPKSDELINQFGKIRVLMLMAEDFHGWNLHAAWDDAVFGIKRRHAFAKIAVVGAGKWIKWGADLGAKIMDGEVRTYSDAQLQEALQWVQS